jgi:uncharacterized protein
VKHRCRLTIAIVAVLGLISAFSAWYCLSSREQAVTIATGTEGGTYYVLGQEFARVLNELPGGAQIKAEAVESEGSFDNLKRLIRAEKVDPADIAFVMKPALTRADPSEVRILARLYMDVVQVVVWDPEDEIDSLAQLKVADGAPKKRVFIGAEDSGTRIVAEDMLDSCGISREDYDEPDAIGSFDEAADRLIDGTLDAGFFVAGLPNDAVTKAMTLGKCRLLDFRDYMGESESTDYLEKTSIPGNRYPNQPDKIVTVGTDVLLACRSDLNSNLGEDIVRGFFDNIGDLLTDHTILNDIDFERAFNFSDDELLGTFELHEGATNFKEEVDKQALLILTGALNGKYYDLGKRIQMLLETYHIQSLVVPTDGSLENAELLSRREGSALAIMQYDIALAARSGRTKAVYNKKLGGGLDILHVNDEPLQIDGLRRIATLHEEQAHLLVLRNSSGKSTGEEQGPEEGEKQTSIEGEDEGSEEGEKQTSIEMAINELLLEKDNVVTICVGPKKSGTRILTQAILAHHDIDDPSRVSTVHLSVPDMIDRLLNGQIDIASFVCDVPSKALQTVLNDPQIKLLSVEPQARARMVQGPALQPDTIEPGQYACLSKSSDPIQTIATRAVLVIKAGSGVNVKNITKAIFEGAAFLAIQDEEKTTAEDLKKAMAEDLPLLPLHPMAEKFYRDAQLLPPERSFATWFYEWLTMTWRLLAVLVILGAGYKGLVMYKRDRISNEIGRRVLAISVEAEEPNSVARLLGLRSEIHERVRRRFWRLGELNKPRWGYLRDLTDNRLRESRENMTRALVQEIHDAMQDSDLDRTERIKNRNALEQRIWQCFESGEVFAAQQEMLLRMLRESDMPEQRENQQSTNGQ